MEESLASGQEAIVGTVQLCHATISVSLPVTGKKAMAAGLSLQVMVQCESTKELQMLLHKNVDELFDNWDASLLGVIVPVIK